MAASASASASACLRSPCLSPISSVAAADTLVVQPLPHPHRRRRTNSFPLPAVSIKTNNFSNSNSGFAFQNSTLGPQCSRIDAPLTLGAADDHDIHALLQILPHDVRDNLLRDSNRHHLLEVILDVGRPPQACYFGDVGRRRLRKTEVSMEELEHAQNAIGELGGDNRAGIVGTLHRISAIRNKNGKVIGLTCRVGRPHRENMDLVRDLLEYGRSILFLGRPGVGKTTVMRGIARVLSDDHLKRVVIVDTSNEIGGDGDIPHPAIGRARRLQVSEPCMQHKVMIEAVENHMPEVIIVDEIGTEAEVQACRTIAQRGVMLIGSAHGKRLEDVIKNPTLSDLIGGLETVTLSDQEARTRNCKKSILERRAAPTFPFLIEMRERHYWVAHRTDKSVDELLRGQNPLVEVRRRDKQFKVVIERWKSDD